MIIAPPKVRQIDRDILTARRQAPARRSRRQRWLVLHAAHRPTGLDNHDQCSCGAVFWRPNGA